MPFGPDDVAEQLAVIAVGTQDVGDAHAGLDARQTQDLDRMIERIAFHVLVRAAHVCGGIVVDVRAHAGAAEAGEREERGECGHRARAVLHVT